MSIGRKTIENTFGDWVASKFYYAFGRRSSWFHEVQPDSSFDVTDTDTYELIPSGTMFKQAEDQVDYLIVDEAQDFNISDYKSHFAKRARKSLSLFGDTKQQMNSHGSNIKDIAEGLDSKQMSLDYNYRLPKAIAKVAQQIIGGGVDLMSNNQKDGGNSDYPNYPKPIITQYANPEKELEGILTRIQMEDLDDVAILVPSDKEVMMVNDYLANHGIKTQVMYRTGNTVPFRTVNTLDFSNNDLPCILTYYAAKGSEFDNVFVPFANTSNDCSRNSFYVACTRSSRSLYISYSGTKTKYLSDVNSDFITELKAA